MGCGICCCRAACVVRCFHTALVLGVPTSLLFTDSALKRAVVDFDDPIYAIGYILLVFLSLFLYYLTICVEPGYVQKQKKKTTNTNNNNDYSDSSEDTDEERNMIKTDAAKLYRYCDYCELEQPMRSKHCEDCKKCVRKYDHHCPWLETCVGERNHKYFWMFLGTVSLLIFWTTVIAWSAFKHQLTWTEWFESNIILVIDTIILVLGGMSAIGLFCFHSYLMIKGLTTWEVASRERITYLKYLDHDFNPFDEGCLRNVYYFLTICKIKRWEVKYEKTANIRKSKTKNVA